MRPNGLDPIRPGTSRADPAGSPAATQAARMSGPWSRTGTPESQPRQEGGSTTLPDEGDTKKIETQLLLSVEEAADVLRLGRTRTYELMMAKKIQSVKVGRRRLVVRTSLLDFVQKLLLEQECA
jgi:excisionase family DNA binding protein